jgi:hypothetical protein
MKTTFIGRVILPALVFGFFGQLPVSALASATPTEPANSSKVPPPILDNDEMGQLQKVRAQVLAANPDLKAEEEKLKSMHDAQAKMLALMPDQKNAAFAEWKAYQKKMRAAMLKIDPTLSPLFAKLDAARKNGSPTPFQPATVNKKTD